MRSSAISIVRAASYVPRRLAEVMRPDILNESAPLDKRSIERVIL